MHANGFESFVTFKIKLILSVLYITNMSKTHVALRRFNQEQIAMMKDRFGKAKPPSLPECDWAMDGTMLKLMTSDGTPAQLTLNLDTTMIYVKDGALSLVVEYAAGPDGKPNCPTGKYLYDLFGPGGKSAKAVSQHLSSMVGSKGLKIPGGIKNASAVAKVVNADLEMTAGKPNLMPAPFKVRLTEEGTTEFRFGMTVYLQKEAKPSREEGSVPADVEQAFEAAVADGADIEGNPIMDYFRANPDRTSNSFATTVAGTGSASCWEVLMRTLNRGQKSWYCKLLAQLTIGGISIKFNAARKILTCSMYLNRSGLEVFGNFDMSRDGAIGPSEDILAIYSELGLDAGVKRRASELEEESETTAEDELAAEVYEEALKKARVE